MIFSSRTYTFWIIMVTSMIFTSEARSVFNGTWTVASIQVNPRRRFGMACTPDTIYVLGGERSDGTLTPTLWMYSLTSKRWTNLQPAGDFPPTQFHTLSYVFPALYVYGGTTGTIPNSDMYILDLHSTNGTQKNTWVKFIVSEGPSARMRHKVVTAGTSLYYFFGRGIDRLLNTVWAFDTNTRIWTRVHGGGSNPQYPTQRFDSCCKYWTERQASLCFGGMTSVDDTNDLWIFFHTNNTWKEIKYSGTVIPQIRRGHTCGIRNGVFLIFGGFLSSTGENIGKDVLQIDMTPYPSPVKWEMSVQPDNSLLAPEARDSAGMCDRFNQTTMLFGGIDQAGTRHNDLWAMERYPNGSLYFRMVNDDASYPRVRSGGVARTMGKYIMFGMGLIEPDTYADDIWQLDTTTLVWKQISVLFASPFKTRTGTAAVVRGQMLVFFGGATDPHDAGELSSELISFDTQRQVWRSIDAIIGTTGRAWHGMVNSGLNYLVFGGFKSCTSSSRTCLSNDLILFDPVVQRWYDVKQSGASISARQAFGFVVNTVDRQVYVIGGLNSRASFNDRYVMSPVVQKGDSFSVSITKLNSTIAGGASARAFFRGAGATAGLGSHYITCGGLTSSTVGTDEQFMCIEYNAKTGENILLPPPPRNLYHSGVAYSGGKVYIIAGAMQAMAVPIETFLTNEVLVLDTPASTRCAGDTNDDTDCLLCAPGSTNTDCSFAPAGTYQPNPAKNPVKCPAGTFSSYLGAHASTFCRFCDPGYYSPSEGLGSCLPCPEGYVCPLGTQTPQPFSGAEDSTVQQKTKQPRQFLEGETPSFVFWIYMAVTIVAVLTVVNVMIVAKWRQRRRIAYFLPETIQNKIQDVFVMYAGPHGVDLPTILKIVREVKLPLKHIDDDEIRRVFQECNVYGTNRMTFRELLGMFCRFIECGDILPFDETAAAVHGSKYPYNYLDSIELANFDSFVDGHRNILIGNPIILCQTTIGGSVAISQKLLTLILIGLLFTMFTYDNIFETRTVLPAELVNLEEVISDFSYTFSIEGSNDPSLCVVNSKCASAIVVGSAGIKDNSTSTNCEFVAPSTCNLVWKCKDCTIISTPAWVNVTFHPSAFSVRTRVELVISAGVEFFEGSNTLTEDSTVTNTYVATDGFAFKGFPATVVDITLTPTLFESPRDSYDNTGSKDSGFHIRYNSASRGGNAVDAQVFAQYFGVPIAVRMDRSETTLQIKRVFKQTLLGFLTGLMGAISGLGGAMVFVLNLFEDWETSYREKQLKTARQYARPIVDTPPCQELTPTSAHEAHEDEDKGRGVVRTTRNPHVLFDGPSKVRQSRRSSPYDFDETHN
eukprot:PhF_6_TR13374/c0_g1_i1/m.21225